MRRSYLEFELQVQHLCNPEDFKKNKSELKNLRMLSYETFISLLKLGGEIANSIKACEIIFKLSTETLITEAELVRLSVKFRFINALIDEKS